MGAEEISTSKNHKNGMKKRKEETDERAPEKWIAVRPNRAR